MAYRSFKSRARSYGARTRVIVQRVRSYRPRNKKQKTLLLVGAAAVAAFLFKDKIAGLIKK